MSGSFDDDAAGARAVYLHERKLAREAGGPIMKGHTAGQHWTSQCACVWTGDRENPQMVDPCTAHLVWMQDKARHNRAAPLLLEALKEARTALYNSVEFEPSFKSHDDVRGVYARIDSAIAAATRSET